ncbi:hypothetical protein Tco_0472636 [Tanacetum coccineum]
MDSENDNDKVNMPSFLSPEPTVSYFNDLDYLKDFENEFPAIVYYDALTSKSDFLAEPIVNPQHIDELNETSLSECDEEEQNVLYFNDLFPFNVIYPDVLKSGEDNDGEKDDTKQPTRDIFVISSPDKINTDVYTHAHRDQRHQYLRFEGLEYTDADITDFEERLGSIYGREIHQVQVFDFGGLTDLMVEGLSSRILMEYKDAQGQSMFTSRAWRRLFKFQLGGVRRRISLREFILGMGLHTAEEIESVGFDAYWAESARQILDKGYLSAYWVGISSAGDFLGTTPSCTSIRNLMLRLCHRLIACRNAGRSQEPKKVTVTDLFYLKGIDVGSVNILYLLARYLRMFASRRRRGAMISGGQFVARLAEHFGLLTEERLKGLTVIIRDLLVIDIVKLVVAVGALEVAEDAPDVDEGDQAVSAPVQVPQPSLATGPARTMTHRIARLEEDMHEMRGTLGEQREVLDSMARDFS